MRQFVASSLYSRSRKSEQFNLEYLSRMIYNSYFCFLPSYWNVEMEKTGRKVEFFTWGFQPKRGQHIGGIGEREA